jgi:histidyl-tRNA synthetase
MTSTKPPGGTRDFLPADVRRREHVIGVVRSVYEAYGFEPLETPAFENIETLLGKYGEEGNKLIFKILRRGEHEATGEADMALRYDLTVPLARVIAGHQNDLPKFFKRYQIQPVWRADRPAKGRFREFFQCDIDAIGSTSPVVEAEMLAAVADVLAQLGFSDFVIRLNHRVVLRSLLEAGGVPAARHETALVAFDKLDKIGAEGVVRELLARGVEMRPEVLSAVLTHGSGGESGWLRTLLADHAEGVAALEVIDDIARMAGAASAAAASRVRLDATLARGLSYYTGAIMEIAVPDLSGSLGGGGRYDNLIGMFLGRDVPACGFSLGLERILVVMAERRMFPPEVDGGPVDAMVAMWSDDTRADALRLAGELRGAGLRVDVYPESDKLGKQFKYASARQVPFVAVLGDEERARGAVGVKDLRSGHQEGVARADAASYISARLGPGAPKLENQHLRTPRT